jgi:hypothetical protein
VQFNRGAGVTAGDASRIHQAVSVSAGIYTGSIWLKLNAGTSASLVLITGDGAGSVAPTSQTITVTNAWQRFQLTSQDASTTYVGVQLEGDVGAASTVDVLAWGGQIIAGVNAMKYLPTVGSTASATDYSISAVGLITFTSAPVLNLPLMWTGSFYYRCEFSDDQLDFAEFMNHLWDLKTLALEQIFL